ncbi:MAG: ABC transporter permease subunit [Planctomycetota bacterium]
MNALFRLQVREMIGGKKLWLVLLLLSFPLLLTWIAMSFGGLGRLKSNLEYREWARNHPEEAYHEGRQIIGDVREGPLEYLQGRIVIDESGFRFKDHHFGGLDRWFALNGDWLLFRGGLLSLDPKQETPDEDQLMLTSLGTDEDVDWQTATGIFLFTVYCQAIAVLMALLYASPLLNTELEGKTLPYLHTRPIARWKIIVGKFAGIATVLTPLHLTSLVLAWLLLELPGGTNLLQAEAAAAVAAILCYNALFILVGYMIPARAMIVAVIYIVLEAFISYVPALINRVSVTYYVRTLAIELSGLIHDARLPEELKVIAGREPLSTSLLVLASIVVGSLTLASLLAARREYIVTEKA